MPVARSTIRRMLLDFTEKFEEPKQFSLQDFDVRLRIRGEEVQLDYYGPPRAVPTIPEEAVLKKMAKADLIELLRSL